jgi:predicted transcriptional regulator
LKDILPFFEKYNLFLRVYDCFGKLVHRHDPLTYDNNNKKMYCMIKGNHVYTLNHNLKSLNQKIEDDDDTFKVKVHTDYYIKEDKEPIPCRMFENIDDLLKIFKEKQENKSDKEKEIINLILKDNDLSQLVFELKEAGYEPSIKRQACRITFIGITLENIIFIIKSQQLVPDEIDGSVSVSSDVVYNNMNKVFNTFNNQIFKKEHVIFLF